MDVQTTPEPGNTTELVHPLAARLGELLRRRGWTVGLAESCTGGLIASLITDVAGSSDYFMGSAVTYANAAKAGILGVQQQTLDEAGAVSAETAAEMAQGARRIFATTLAASVTGIAGPTGATPAKPLGLTYIHLSGPHGERSERHLFDSNRMGNKLLAAEAVLRLGIRYLEEPAPPPGQAAG
jgi:PncC family amidohydrolase